MKIVSASCLYTSESQWPNSATEGLENKKQEIESYVSSPMSLTDEDKTMVGKLVTRALELAVSPDHNALHDDGVFLHLEGLRPKQYPMGVQVWAIKKEDAEQEFGIQFVLSSPSFLVNGRTANNIRLVTMDADDVKKARSSKKVRRSWVKKILSVLEHEIKQLEDWEGRMTQYGFYILPTGFESACPVGEDGWLLCMREVAQIRQFNSTPSNHWWLKMQYAKKDWVSEICHDGFQNVPELVREVIKHSPALEIMTGIPDKLKRIMTGV